MGKRGSAHDRVTHAIHYPLFVDTVYPLLTPFRQRIGVPSYQRRDQPPTNLSLILFYQSGRNEGCLPLYQWLMCATHEVEIDKNRQWDRAHMLHLFGPPFNRFTPSMQRILRWLHSYFRWRTQRIVLVYLFFSFFFSPLFHLFLRGWCFTFH